MILPVVAYGNAILRKVCEDIGPDYPGLKELIANMWETMYKSSGVGIAAPQINKPIRLFLIDTLQVVEDFDDEDKEMFPTEKGYKGVFINARLLEESGEPWGYTEGCLSIPTIREEIRRGARIRIRFLDENFREHEKEFDQLTARVILHEYDHIEGKLFIDHIAPLKKRLLKKKLDDIMVGKVKVDYKMLFSK